MLSLVILALMFGAMLTLGVALVWAIGGNLRRGDEVRRKLARNLENLRLGRALGLLGIDRSSYLHSQRIVDIEAQMRNCSDCSDQVRCDSSLDKGHAGELDFCPNEESLNAMRAAALGQSAQQ